MDFGLKKLVRMAADAYRSRHDAYLGQNYRENPFELPAGQNNILVISVTVDTL